MSRRKKNRTLSKSSKRKQQASWGSPILDGTLSKKGQVYHSPRNKRNVPKGKPLRYKDYHKPYKPKKTKKPKTPKVKVFKGNNVKGNLRASTSLMPPVQYKIVASGSHVVEAVKDKPKLNQPLFIVLAVLSLVVIIPMMAGGTIALAAALSSEDHYATTPDDANGYRVIGSSTDSTNHYCSWKASSLPTGSYSTIYTRNSVNYTQVHTQHTQCSNTAEYLEIQLPSDVLPNPSNLTMSKFSFTMLSRNYRTGLSDVEKTSFDFDININGTSVIYRNNHSTFAGLRDTTTDNVHYLLNFNITPTTSEILDFNNEVGKCWPSCIVSVNLSDYKTTGVQEIPWEQGGQMDLQTVVYTTDADTAGVVLTVAPYLLALVNMLVALASTSFWNPVFGSLKKKAGAY